MIDNTYSGRIKASYGEVFTELSRRYAPAEGGHLRTSLLPYIKKHPVRSTIMVGASAVAIGASAYGLGLYVTIAQAVGIPGLMLTREAATFKEHRHILSTASLACALATLQQGMMVYATADPGAYIPGSVMVGHAAATLAVFAIVPEVKTSFRRAVTWAGGIGGAVAAGYASYKYGSANGIIPAITTLGNSILFSIKDDNTPRARLGYIGMNIAHAFYWATQPIFSLAPLAAEAFYLVTHTTSAAQYDMPVANRETGHPLTARERCTAYFKEVLWRGRRADHVGITHREQEWERPDNKVYKRVGYFVFGPSETSSSPAPQPACPSGLPRAPVPPRS